MKKFLAFAVLVFLIGHVAANNATPAINAHFAAIEQAASY